MKFGMSAPNRGAIATAENLKVIANTAENLGYDCMTISDHIVVPRTVDHNYPYSETGEFRWIAEGNTDCMEQFALLAWLAAITSKIRLVTSVIVIPHRNPLFMAKALATVDVLSGGRLTVGCGAGWMAEEFAALNLPPFEARGRVTDEYIEAMKVAWTDPNPSFDGEFVKFDHIDMNPRPLQHPHPPIWIGGESMPAMRRTAAIGDAWYPFGSNPKFRMDKIETFTARLAKLHQHAEKIDRDPASIELAYNCAFHDSKEAQHVDGGRQSFTGSAQQRADDIGQFAAAGVSNIVVNVGAGDLNAMLDRMEEFASNVMPLVD